MSYELEDHRARMTAAPVVPPPVVQEGSFEELANLARSQVTPGKVNWNGSPYAWMINNDPVTKNAIGREIIRLWLERKRAVFEIGPGGTLGHHFLVAGQRVAVHFATQGKEGDMRFSALREPEMGIDVMYLLGIEPHRARLWMVRPEQTSGFLSFNGDIEGLHSLCFDPDDVPVWLRACEVVL